MANILLFIHSLALKKIKKTIPCNISAARDLHYPLNLVP